MAMPTLSSVAQRIYDILEPLHRDDAGQDYDLAKYVGGLAQPFQSLEDMAVGDTDEVVWSKLFDPYQIPAEGLDWVAQFTGIRLEAGYTDLQKRDAISSRLGWNRGTPQAMADAAALFLTGAKTVVFRERHPTPYSISVLTRLEETPPEDWPATNLIPNGGFETNTTGWSAQGGHSIARSSEQARYGSWSLKVTTVAAASAAMAAFAAGPFVANTIQAMSADIYIPTAWDGGQIQIGHEGQLTGATLVVEQQPNMLLRDQWQRIWAVWNVAADNVGGFFFRYNSAVTAGKTVYIDGVQLEVNPGASPYIETDGGTASRAAGLGRVGAAIRAQKPAGLILTYAVLLGQDYQELYDTHATYQLVFTDYATYQELIEDA